MLSSIFIKWLSILNAASFLLCLFVSEIASYEILSTETIHFQTCSCSGSFISCKSYSGKEMYFLNANSWSWLTALSNDGSFIHHLTSPKKHIAKKYYVEYSGTLLEDSEDLVKKGLNIDNEYTTLPAILERISLGSAYITIYEGKFHQVKKMFDKLNTKVTYLKRVKIGNLELDDLKLGQIREW